MDATLLALGFTTGLVTSLHCVGMCGPLVLAVGLAGGTPTLAGSLLRSAAWNAGRGAALVAVGAAIGSVGSLIPAGRGAAILALTAGVLVLLVALALPGWLPLPRALRIRAEAWGSRTTQRLLQRRGAWGAALVGAATVLLPCGPLYGVWAQAAAVGTWGALLLLSAFWAGTVPALVALAVGGGVLRPALRRWAMPIAAVTLALSGGLLIFRGVKFLFILEQAGPACH